METKKGIQLNQAFGAVLTLVLVAVLVIIAIVIFVSLSSSFTGTSSDSQTAETLTAVTESPGVALAASTTNCSFGSPTIVTMVNSSATLDILAPANYSVSNTGIVTFTGSDADAAMGYNNSIWQANYTWKWGSDACTASDDMVSEFSNYTSLVGLVGTIIFLGLVIGILVAAFAFGGRREV